MFRKLALELSPEDNRGRLELEEHTLQYMSSAKSKG